MQLDVHVQYTCPIPAPPQAFIKRCAEAALTHIGVAKAELTVRIVDAAESTRLNRDYRQKDGPTNILSFVYAAPPGTDAQLVGDLIICAPVVVREAEEQGKSQDAHWAHMLVHGIMHLHGYDHVTEDQANLMESQEAVVLQKLGFSDPYT